MAWWTEARFGMFIHWGLYALAARHEWVKNHEHIRDEEYQKYFDHFDPDLYDPQDWARPAKARRDEILRHHDQAPRGLLPLGLEIHRLQGDEHALRQGPAQADGRGVPGRGPPGRVSTTRSSTGTTPITPSTGSHPMFNNPEFREKAKNRDMAKYAEYLHNQVRELLTEFGHDRLPLPRLFLPGKDGKGTRRLAVGEAPEDDPRAPAEHHHQRPARPARRPGRLGFPDAGAVHAARVGHGERPASALGNLPDVFGIVGLLPRRSDMEKRPAARRHAHRHREQRRQPAAQRRADGPRHVRRPRDRAAGRASANG